MERTMEVLVWLMAASSPCTSSLPQVKRWALHTATRMVVLVYLDLWISKIYHIVCAAELQPAKLHLAEEKSYSCV